MMIRHPLQRLIQRALFRDAPRRDMMFSSRQLAQLLAPLIAEQLLSYLVGLSDSMMVSSNGEAAVSAVSLVDSISTLMINLFSALATGGAVVVGQYYGRGDMKRARQACQHLLVILLVSSLAITAFLLVGQSWLLQLMFGHAEAAVMDNCRIYYRIVMLSVPFIALFDGSAALFRVCGDSRTPMLVSLLMNAINVGGNAVLIYAVRMGIAGVAIPTLISRFVAMTLILAGLGRRTFPLNLRGAERLRPNHRMVLHILSIGIPNGVENSMFQLGKILLLSLVSTLPTAAIAANAIGNTVANFHALMGISINLAMVPVVSRCVGAGDYVQARWYIRKLTRLDYICQGGFCVLMLAAIPLILRLYNVSSEAAVLATYIMLIHGTASILIWPTAFALNNGMRAAGDARFSMIVGVASMWLLRVCLGYLLVLHFHTGVLGIWCAWILDWILRSICFIPRFRSHVWENRAFRD